MTAFGAICSFDSYFDRDTRYALVFYADLFLSTAR